MAELIQRKATLDAVFDNADPACYNELKAAGSRNPWFMRLHSNTLGITTPLGDSTELNGDLNPDKPFRQFEDGNGDIGLAVDFTIFGRYLNRMFEYQGVAATPRYDLMNEGAAGNTVTVTATPDITATSALPALPGPGRPVVVYEAGAGPTIETGFIDATGGFGGGTGPFDFYAASDGTGAPTVTTGAQSLLAIMNNPIPSGLVVDSIIGGVLTVTGGTFPTDYNPPMMGCLLYDIAGTPTTLYVRCKLSDTTLEVVEADGSPPMDVPGPAIGDLEYILPFRFTHTWNIGATKRAEDFIVESRFADFGAGAEGVYLARGVKFNEFRLPMGGDEELIATGAMIAAQVEDNSGQPNAAPAVLPIFYDDDAGDTARDFSSGKYDQFGVDTFVELFSSTGGDRTATDEIFGEVSTAELLVAFGLDAEVRRLGKQVRRDLPDSTRRVSVTMQTWFEDPEFLRSTNSLADYSLRFVRTSTIEGQPDRILEMFFPKGVFEPRTPTVDNDQGGVQIELVYRSYKEAKADDSALTIIHVCEWPDYTGL